MFRAIVLILLLGWVVDSAIAQEGASAKPELRILFVGHDPDAPRVMFPQLATDRTYALHRERTPAFESLLRYHFKNVRVVYSADYLVEMSDDVDVTIFDALPKPVSPLVHKAGSYTPPSYLPDTFNRPVLTISGASSGIGDTFGSKLDWL